MLRTWSRTSQAACCRCGRRHLITLAAATLVGLAMAWLAGCQPRPVPAGTATATATLAAATTPAPRRTITAPAAAPISGEVMALTWWLPDFLSPAAAGSGPLVSRYVHEFETASEGRVRVDPVVKARYGRGGLLDLMRAAQPVAPDILPDLVALDLADVAPAAAAGLLQPLDPVLDTALWTDLYPFARQAGQFSGRILAVPFAADLEHVIYRRDRVQVPPVTWADLYAGKVTYVFPMGSPQLPAAGGQAESLQRAFISQYLSAGGTVIPATRTLYLDGAALERVLTLYSQARDAQLLPPNALEVTSLDDCWQAFSEGDVAMADVSARRYLAGRESLPNTGFAPLPGWNGPAVPVASGWALAIVTTNPARQRAAAAWISWLLATDRLTAWAQAADWLPVAPRAWVDWGSSPYFEFLQGQMAIAVAGPAGISDPQAAGQVQKAVVAVLRDGVAPANAVRAILTPVPK